MGKKKFTELDKLFQSKLKDENIENGAWNNPTDDAFISAMKNIEPHEIDEKKKIVWWPYLILLFIPVLILGIWNAGQMSELKSEIDEINAQVNQASTLPESLINETNNSTEVKTDLSTKENVKTTVNEKKLPSTEKPVVKISNASSAVTKKKQVVNNNSNAFTSVNGFDTNRNVVTKFTRDSEFKVTEADALPLFLFPKDSLKRIAALRRLSNIQNLDYQERNKIRISGLNLEMFMPEPRPGLAAYAFFDLNLNTIRMSGMEPSSFTLTGYDDSHMGYEFGLGLVQELNRKWSINYTASYRHVTNRSQYESDFMFEEDNLITDVDGELVYQLFSELQTPTGAYINNRDLAFAEMMDDNVMMNEKADIKLLFNFVSVGAKPRFSLFQNNNFNVFAEAGLNVNYLVHYCQSLDMKFYYENKMMMGNYVDDYSMSKLNRFSFTTSLGLGLEYNLGDRFFSSIRLGSSRSLNSIKQLDVNNDNTRTYIDNLGLSLSAGYRF